MIVLVNPLTTPLVRKLIDVAGTGFDRRDVDRFLADEGWEEPMAYGIDIGGQHILGRNHPDGVDVETLWVPFCWLDDDAGMLDPELWEPEWKDSPGDQIAFDTAWKQACGTVEAEIGQPEVTVRGRTESQSPADRWNLAAWRIGSVALIVGQTMDDFSSQGDLELAGIWLFKNAPDADLPAAGELQEWLIAGKKDPRRARRRRGRRGGHPWHRRHGGDGFSHRPHPRRSTPCRVHRRAAAGGRSRAGRSGEPRRRHPGRRQPVRPGNGRARGVRRYGVSGSRRDQVRHAEHSSLHKPGRRPRAADLRRPGAEPGQTASAGSGPRPGYDGPAACRPHRSVRVSIRPCSRRLPQPARAASF